MARHRNLASRSLAGAVLAALMASGAHGMALWQPEAPVEERRERPVPTLTVSGEGEVSSPPDRAVVTLGAVAQAEQASAAQEQVNAVMRATIEAVRAIGIEEASISTVGVSLYPVYSDRQPRPAGQRLEPEPEPRIVAYRASNSVRVVIDDLSKVGDAIDAGVTAGANQVQGLSFELQDDTQARGEALTAAAKQARAKAEALAAALGLSLDSVLAVSEGGVDVIGPRMDYASARVSLMSASTPVQPGQVDVQATVTIRYRISPSEKPWDQ